MNGNILKSHFSFQGIAIINALFKLDKTNNKVIIKNRLFKLPISKVSYFELLV